MIVKGQRTKTKSALRNPQIGQPTGPDTSLRQQPYARNCILKELMSAHAHSESQPDCPITGRSGHITSSRKHDMFKISRHQQIPKPKRLRSSFFNPRATACKRLKIVAAQWMRSNNEPLRATPTKGFEYTSETAQIHRHNTRTRIAIDSEIQSKHLKISSDMTAKSIRTSSIDAQLDHPSSVSNSRCVSTAASTCTPSRTTEIQVPIINPCSWVLPIERAD